MKYQKQQNHQNLKVKLTCLLQKTPTMGSQVQAFLERGLLRERVVQQPHLA